MWNKHQIEQLKVKDIIKHLMPSKVALDALADQIRNGIAEFGDHSLFHKDLEIIWGNGELSEEQKRPAVEKFATNSGFTVWLSPHFEIARFKKPD